jgi:hypothetical protein
MICIIFGWRCQGGSWRKVVYVIIIKIPTRQCFLDNDSTSHVEHPTMVLWFFNNVTRLVKDPRLVATDITPNLRLF